MSIVYSNFIFSNISVWNKQEVIRYIFMKRAILQFPFYSQVERVDLYGWTVSSIERGCTDECLYGCRYNGYGVTLERCYSCCRTPLCNTDNAATYTTVTFWKAVFWMMCFISTHLSVCNLDLVIT